MDLQASSQHRYKVVVVDDDMEMRESLEHFLDYAGCDVTSYISANAALDGLSQTLAEDFPEVLLTDLRMPGLSGLDLLERIKLDYPLLAVVLLSAHGDVPMAVEAMQKGAYSFLEKPFEPSRLFTIIQHAVETARLAKENLNLRARISQLSGLDHVLLGESPAMREIKEDIRHIADTEASVMVLGETGTGKEVVARAIHELSKRVTEPFVAVNCAAIPENLFEASMFGHMEGAFTGASSASKGYFVSAEGGTLFLDELGACPLDQQAKLLRALEMREVTPVGSTQPVKVDIRVVCATNENLEEAVKEGRFREDLYYRLNTLILELPPLRQIKSDLVLLFTHFMTEYAATYGTMLPHLSNEDVAALMGHDWPGNVRELRQVAERRILANRRGKGNVAEALLFSQEAGEDTENLRDAMAIYERQLIVKAMEKYTGEMEVVAAALGIGRRTLNEKLVKYDIRRTNYTS